MKTNKIQENNIINDATFQALLNFTPFVTYFVRDEEYDIPCKQHSQGSVHPLSWELIQHLAAKHGVSTGSVEDLYFSEITCSCDFVIQDVRYV